MKIVGTRTYLEVRVGRHQSVEVLLHLRRSDVAWFQQNADFLRTELLDLLQSSVLPRLFADEMEQNNAALTKTKLPPKLGPGGIPMTVGEKNKTTTTTASTANSSSNNKRKRGLSKKKQAELKRQREEEERERRKNEKDIYYATGGTIRVAYRTEAVSSAGATLLFQEAEEQNDDDKNTDGEEATSKKKKQKKAKQQDDVRFRALKKLSKRLIIWCYPANAELPASEGFWRPEIIPMATLFRMPASEVETAATTPSNQQQQQQQKPVIDLLDD